ncbi:DsbA family protein [Bacillus velezensis]
MLMRKLSITAVPTFIIGDERIPGAAGKETFEQIIERELNKR